MHPGLPGCVDTESGLNAIFSLFALSLNVNRTHVKMGFLASVKQASELESTGDNESS